MPPSKPNHARKGDDRNLVIVDQDFGQPDLEDRMWLFWIRNRVFILGISAILVIGALGYITWSAISDYKLSSMQGEYRAVAQTSDARLSFARKNQGTPISGIAAIEAGDQLYKENKFAEAEAAYAFALGNFSLDDKFATAFAGRAKLGIALARINNADRDGGVKVLTELAQMPRFLATHRGEAIYKLVVLALEKNDLTEARKWFDTLDRELPPANEWAKAKQELLRLEPTLMQPEPVPVAEAPASVEALPAAAPTGKEPPAAEAAK
jgi:tetratricopeptide (TPR) repeat protein